MNHEMTPEEHVEAAVAAAIDLSCDYDATPDWREGDAFCQNLIDSMKSDGYDADFAFYISIGFISAAKRRGVRFMAG